jgi:hypothetical protein
MNLALLISAALAAALCAFFGLKPWIRPSIDDDDPDEVQTIFDRKKLK